VLALATTSNLATAAPASASSDQTAINTKYIAVNFPPLPGNYACTSREIILAAGKYRWRRVFVVDDWTGRIVANEPWRDDIRLAAGTYTWVDCIGYNRTYPSLYEQSSYLEYRLGKASVGPVWTGFSYDTFVEFGSTLTPVW
jgi:hypothetical protein